MDWIVVLGIGPQASMGQGVGGMVLYQKEAWNNYKRCKTTKRHKKDKKDRDNYSTAHRDTWWLDKHVKLKQVHRTTNTHNTNEYMNINQLKRKNNNRYTQYNCKKTQST